MRRIVTAGALLLSLAFNDTPAPVHHPYIPTDSLHSRPAIAPSVMAQWAKVAWCESHGNWSYDGPRYDGGLGISRVNWVAYGGHDFAPAPHLATPMEQVIVAQRIQGSNQVPDQDGECRAW